jgi:hypothetical protein
MLLCFRMDALYCKVSTGVEAFAQEEPTRVIRLPYERFVRGKETLQWAAAWARVVDRPVEEVLQVLQTYSRSGKGGGEIHSYSEHPNSAVNFTYHLVDEFFQERSHLWSWLDRASTADPDDIK